MKITTKMRIATKMRITTKMRIAVMEMGNLPLQRR